MTLPFATSVPKHEKRQPDPRNATFFLNVSCSGCGRKVQSTDFVASDFAQIIRIG